MNSENTHYLNNEENPTKDEITTPIPPKTKKSGMPGKAKVAVAGAAGVVTGTVVGAGAVGVAVAANQNHEATLAEANETETTTDSNTEVPEAIVADVESDTPAEEPQQVTHVTHVTNNYYVAETPNNPEHPAEAPAEDQQVKPVQQELPVEPVPDDEVRILGVETVHTPEGLSMDVVGVAVGDDPALFVDVNQDGYLDVFIHDDNGNGYIEENEIYDISGANMHMADLGIQMDHDDFLMASDEASIEDFDDPNIMPV